MHDWNSLTLEALRTLGADKMMVPGSKLRQRMVEVGQAEGFDVGAHVAVSGIPFSKLAANVAGVTIKEQLGSDVLIGLQGARATGRTDTPWFSQDAIRHIFGRTYIKRSHGFPAYPMCISQGLTSS